MQERIQEQGWTDEMLLGLTVMDRSHQGLFAELALLAHATDEALAARFADFVAKVEQDFNTEEVWMEEINFPGIRPHLEEHAMVLSALHHAAPHVVDGDLAAARDIIRLMPQWFAHHLTTQDKALALALQMASIPV
jgi:hemerythrin-like metal-binding protein